MESIRALSGREDFAAALALQQEVWGGELAELISPGVMKVAALIGAVAGGAFDDEGRLLGFVWGLSGVRRGRPAHWSHMLAVRPEARDAGLGRRLKRFQREQVLALGPISVIHWTYDPLEARNAHLNFNRLGVSVGQYVEDFYGSGESSPRHRGIGTDRFIVDWELEGERCQRALADEPPRRAERFAAVPVVNVGTDGSGPSAEADLPSLPAVRVEIPADVQRLKAAAPPVAAAWRRSTRRAFEHYLAHGLTVDTFYREGATGRCFYGLC